MSSSSLRRYPRLFRHCLDWEYCSRPSPVRPLAVRRKDVVMSLRLGVPLCLWVACSLAAARADEWPQFRGPNGSATSNDKQLPAEWGADKNVAWKAKLA